MLHTQLFSMISFWIYLPVRRLFRFEHYEKLGIHLFELLSPCNRKYVIKSKFLEGERRCETLLANN